MKALISLKHLQYLALLFSITDTLLSISITSLVSFYKNRPWLRFFLQGKEPPFSHETEVQFAQNPMAKGEFS